MVAGALAGVVSISRPVYLVVALPLLVAAGSRARMLRVALGLGVVVAVSLLGNLFVRGTWSSYSGERHGYYAYTGFPLEAGAGGAVAVEGAVRPSASWTERLVPFGFDLRVSAWNLLYLLVGRHVGLLPYFLPLLLGFVAWRSSASSWALLGAFAAVAVAFLILRPYNFWGGGGALANRYLLPVYPCLWFLAQRRRGALPVVVVAALAAPFLWPIWTSPRSFFRGEDGNYRHVSTVARHLLPYETTQNQLKPSGHDDFVHRAIDETEEGVHGGGLWIKPLSPGSRRAGDERIELTVGAAEAGLLVGSPRPIAGLELLIGEDAADGASLPVELGWRRAHPMWWTKDAYFLYPVDVEAALQQSPVSYPRGQTVSFRLAVVGTTPDADPP